MNLGGLLGVNDAINQIFTDIWQALVGLLTGIINVVLSIGAVPISATDPASPIAGLWPAMLTVGTAIAVILFFAQLAMAAFHPRRNLVHAFTGPVAYGIAVAVTVTVVAVTLTAADGLTTLVLQQAAHVDDVGGAVAKLGITNTTMTAVKPVALALMAIVALLPLSIGFAVEMLFRAMAILVLVATIPLVAAGLTNMATRHWFWRAARWILAAVFIKPTLAITVAIGVLIIGNAHPGGNGGQSLVTLLLGLGVLFVSLFAPFALYRLFAFVEPGTMPHEAMRSAFNDARSSFSQAAGAVGNPMANTPGLMSDAASRRWGGGNSADPASSAASSPPWPTVGFGGASSGGAGGSSNAAALAGVAAVAATGGAAAPAVAAGSGAAAGTGTGAAAAGTGAGAAAAGTGVGAAAGTGTGAAAAETSSGAAASGSVGGSDAGIAGGAESDTGSPALGSATGGAGAPGLGGASAGGPQDALGSGTARSGSARGALPPGASSGSSPAGLTSGSSGGGWSGEPGAADDPLWSSLPSPGGGSAQGGGGRSGGGGGGRGHYGVGAISGGPSGLPGSVPGAGGGFDAPPPRPIRAAPGDHGPGPGPGRGPGPGGPGPLPGNSPVPRHPDDLVDPPADHFEGDLDGDDDRDEVRVGRGDDPRGAPDDDDRGWRRGEGRGLSGLL